MLKRASERSCDSHGIGVGIAGGADRLKTQASAALESISWV